VHKNVPRDELYGLTSQLHRAAVSIPSNIAEGYGRISRREYRYFLAVARGSNMEAQTQLVIARTLGFGLPGEIAQTEALSEETGRMLSAMLRRLKPESAR
jgi:four helix bundle protein